VAFKKNYIYEVIVEIDTGVKKNFAPMGIKYLGMKGRNRKFEIFVFKNADTARLLTENLNKGLNEKRNFKSFAAIWTSDIRYFYECITKKFSGDFCNKIEKFPKVVFEIEKVEESDNGLNVVCVPKYIDRETEKDIRKNLINRAKYLALESLIYYTKPIANDKKKEKISEALRAIKKVAPDSDCEKLVSDLLLKMK